MCCSIPRSVSHSFNSFGQDTAHELNRIPQALAGIEDRIGGITGMVAYGEEMLLTPISRTCVAIASFIKRNFQPLAAYIFAWGVIITCTGLMYGFQAVALPLTIGLGCGVVFGSIAGVLVLKVFDPSGKLTLWNLLNHVLERLDPNGTRQIVLAVAVTVLLAASVVFPYVLGSIFGIFVGNQLAAKAGTGRDLGRDPDKDLLERDSLKKQMAAMEQKIIEIGTKLQKIDNHTEKQNLTKEISIMMHELEKMQSHLEKIYPIIIEMHHENSK